MVALLLPVFGLRLESSDAGNDPSGTNTREAFDLLAQGFGAGFNGPLLIVTELPSQNQAAAQEAVARRGRQDAGRRGRHAAAGVARRGTSRCSRPTRARPRRLLPPPTWSTICVTTCATARAPDRRDLLVGGFTAGSIDFSHVLANKLPLFIGIVVVLSALLLFVIFRSIVIPIQAALMNLLSIGGALGVTVLVFQKGWFASVIGVEKGPVEPWIPVLMFAVCSACRWTTRCS